MDARPKTRRVNRERKSPASQSPRGAKQIVIPMPRARYDEIWEDARRTRLAVAECARSAPELFPAGFDRGYRLHGFGRESRKLPGLKLRKIVTADTAEEFRRRMGEFRGWCAERTWTGPVGQMLEKLWARTESYAAAYDHPGCHRTSNAVDLPMNRLCRLM